MLKKIFDKILHSPKASDGMFDEAGAIKLDPTPMVEHLPDINGQPSMREALEAFLSRESYRRLQDAVGEESFADSLDFGDERDHDFPGSPYSVADEAQIYEANRLVVEANQPQAPSPPEPLKKPPGGRREAAPEGKGRKPAQRDIEDSELDDQ